MTIHEDDAEERERCPPCTGGEHGSCTLYPGALRCCCGRLLV